MSDPRLSEILNCEPTIPTTGKPYAEHVDRQLQEARGARLQRIEKFVIWAVILLAVVVTVVKGSEVTTAATTAAQSAEGNR